MPPRKQAVSAWSNNPAPNDPRIRARNNAIERTGRALYGEMWIHELSTREWRLARQYGLDDDVTLMALPTQARQATRHAKARIRLQMRYLQEGQVIHWLQHQHEIDLDPKAFDQTKFERWFVKHFGASRESSAKKRTDAAKLALQKFGPPGRGGSPWKPFCDFVRERSSQKCDDRTIKRDVQALLGK